MTTLPSQGIIKDASLPLHKLLNEFEILKIKEAFEREDGRKLNREQLKETIAREASIIYSEPRQYDVIFRKMDSTWYFNNTCIFLNYNNNSAL